MTAAEVVARLDGVRLTRGTPPRQWEARCPAHNDRRASLSVGEGQDGRVLLACQAGCALGAIIAPMGLTERDLFPPRPTNGAAAAARRGEVIATYPYTDETGALLYEVQRIAPKDFRQRRPDGKGGWVWRTGDVRRTLYRLPELIAADPSATVLIPEGEKDCDRLRGLGLVATCNSGGAGKWRAVADDARKVLRGRRVVVLPDNDDPGRAHAHEIARSLTGVAAAVRVVELPGLPPKGDVSDWLAAGGTRVQLEALVAGEREPGADDEPAPCARKHPRAPSLVAEILERAKEQWLPLQIGDTTIASLPPRALAVLMGATGTGKSTLAAALLVDHARRRGPAVYVSLELDAPELATRVIGADTGATWVDTLRGGVAADAMTSALPERLVITEGGSDPIAALVSAVEDLRAEHGAEPILACVDYVQIAGLHGDDVRLTTARVLEGLRAVSKQLRIVTLAVSQSSRAGARELRSGDRLGAETLDAGAETAQIERAAYLTLALGAGRPADADGWAQVELSIGKSRFGGGDRVIPVAYHGAHGRWKVLGEARSASEVRASRTSERETEDVALTRRQILADLARANAPLTVQEIKRLVRRRHDLVTAAIAEALAATEIVQCDPRPRQRAVTYWTTLRRAAAIAADRGRPGTEHDA